MAAVCHRPIIVCSPVPGNVGQISAASVKLLTLSSAVDGGTMT